MGHDADGADRRERFAEHGRSAQELLIRRAAEVNRYLPQNVSRPVLFGFGWYRASVRLAQACLTLHDAELDHEAASLRRSLLEHVTALMWVADSGDVAVNAIQRAHQHWLGRLVASTEGDGWPEIPSEVRSTLDTELPASPEEHLQHMTQRLSAFNMKVFLPPWLSDTAVAHPCLTSARYYWREHPDGSVSFTRTPEVTDGLPSLAGNAVLLMLATLAMSRLLGEVERLTDAAKEAGNLIGVEAKLPVRSS